MTLEPFQIVLGFALALAVGGLVGLERERHTHAERKASIGGARTFPLFALLGALLALLSSSLGPLVFVAGLIAVAALLALGYVNTRSDEGRVRPGLTTELAALLVFVIGAVPFAGAIGLDFPQRLLLAGALGTVTISLLALREPIHEFAQKLSNEDLIAIVRFALIAVVALPLLPDRTYGPFDVLNPFQIGVVTVLIAGISFVGYVASRFLGARRGIGVTALAGGLVSSTAVTLAFSARGRERPELAAACSLGIAVACTVMFGRVLVEILAIRPELLAPAAIPLASMLVAGVLGCLVLWRRVNETPQHEEPAGLHNPFRLRQAIRLGLVYAVIRFVTAAAWHETGSGGLFVSAALSGVADVDAITLSVAGMHATGLETHVAVSAVTIAVVTNTLVKAGLAIALGGRRVGMPVAMVLVPSAAVGVLVSVLAK